MDSNNQMMLWYFAYIHKLTTKAAPVQGRLPIRRWIAQGCGRAALQVGLWLLAEEAQMGIENANGAQKQTVLPHS